MDTQERVLDAIDFGDFGIGHLGWQHVQAGFGDFEIAHFVRRNRNEVHVNNDLGISNYRINL